MYECRILSQVTLEPPPPKKNEKGRNFVQSKEDGGRRMENGEWRMENGRVLRRVISAMSHD